MAYFALFYDVVDDFVDKRKAFRQDHLGHAGKACERGELLLAGALAEPADGALLVFRTDDRAVVESFAREDPYVVAGLVLKWRVRLWNNVIGENLPIDATPRAV